VMLDEPLVVMAHDWPPPPPTPTLSGQLGTDRQTRDRVQAEKRPFVFYCQENNSRGTVSVTSVINENVFFFTECVSIFLRCRYEHFRV
jgi:hypothetical protein